MFTVCSFSPLGLGVPAGGMGGFGQTALRAWADLTSGRDAGAEPGHSCRAVPRPGLRGPWTVVAEVPQGCRVRGEGHLWFL